MSSLVAEDDNKKDGDDQQKKKKKKKQDTDQYDDDPGFGDGDSDWMIYHKLNDDVGDDFDEKLEEELAKIEDLLSRYDPGFWILLEESLSSASFHEQFLHGVLRRNEKEEPHAASAHYQLHLNIERIRVPEILFQPSIVGLECPGVVEMLNDTIQQHPSLESVSKGKETLLPLKTITFLCP